MSYRAHLNATVGYLAELRDRRIDATGVEALVVGPAGDTAYDYYGDPTVDGERETRTLTVLPLYAELAQLNGLFGLADEASNVGLNLLIKTSDTVAEDSVVTLPVDVAPGRTDVRTWRVTAVDVRHLERTYAKVARCVPERADRTAGP